MDQQSIERLATRAGCFPLYPPFSADNTLAFRERALARFVDMIVTECITLCEEHGKSAEFSYTPAKAFVAKKTAFGCAKLIKRKFDIR